MKFNHAIAEKGPDKGDASALDPKHGPSERPKILVVDDDEDVQELCRVLLSDAGYDVDTVSDGMRAQQHVRERDYDLFLIDLMMPKMGGFELLQSLRDSSVDVPVVVLTSHGTTENAVACLRLGVKDFLIKPFCKEDLQMVISGVLEAKRMAKEHLRLRLLLPLFEISREILVETDLNRVLKKILDVVISETRADQAGLLLFSPDSRAVTVREERGACIHRLWGLLDNSVIRTGQAAIWVNQVQYLNPEINRFMRETALSAVIAMPFIVKGKIIGILAVCRGKGNSFNEGDLELMSIFCGQAAVAIENARLFEEVSRKTEEIRRAHFDAISALAEALESKDAYTRGHGDRSVEYAVSVAKKIGLPEARMEYLKYAAILHDIGKIGIPDHILNKPTKLTAEEYEIMKSHPEKGAEILRQIAYLQPVVPLVLYHQEEYDGTGYPSGLSGEAIPLEARIVAVIDAYDAMTSDRIYRKALEKEQAVAELKRCSGTQFDPKVVEAFTQVLAEQGNPLETDPG